LEPGPTSGSPARSLSPRPTQHYPLRPSSFPRGPAPFFPQHACVPLHPGLLRAGPLSRSQAPRFPPFALDPTSQRPRSATHARSASPGPQGTQALLARARWQRPPPSSAWTAHSLRAHLSAQVHQQTTRALLSRAGPTRQRPSPRAPAVLFPFLTRSLTNRPAPSAVSFLPFPLAPEFTGVITGDTHPYARVSEISASSL